MTPSAKPVRRPRLNLGRVRQAHRRNERQALEFLVDLRAGVAGRMDTWLQLLLDCHTFAISHHALDETRYMEAYGTISSIAFQQAEVARVSLLRGFYGKAIATTRTLAVLNDLLLDFVLHPESVDKWLALRRVPPTDDTDAAKKLRGYFYDRNLQKRLKAKGERPLSESLYGITSEAIHAAPWAVQFYSTEEIDRPGVFTIEYRPHYHPFRTLVQANFLLATLPHLCGYFLAANETWGEPYEAFHALKERYFELLDEYETTNPLVGRMIQAMQAALDSVRDGADFDVVMGQLKGLAQAEP